MEQGPGPGLIPALSFATGKRHHRPPAKAALLEGSKTRSPTKTELLDLIHTTNLSIAALAESPDSQR